MDRSTLEKTDYGLPEKKKFPMPDASHVKLAIKFFNYVDKEDEAKLAAAIKRKAKAFGIVVRCGKKNRLSNYISKQYVTEAMCCDMSAVINGSIKQASYESDINNLGFDYVATDKYPYSKKKKKKYPNEEAKIISESEDKSYVSKK